MVCLGDKAAQTAYPPEREDEFEFRLILMLSVFRYLALDCDLFEISLHSSQSVRQPHSSAPITSQSWGQTLFNLLLLVPNCFRSFIVRYGSFKLKYHSFKYHSALCLCCYRHFFCCRHVIGTSHHHHGHAAAATSGIPVRSDSQGSLS